MSLEQDANGSATRIQRQSDNPAFRCALFIYLSAEASVWWRVSLLSVGVTTVAAANNNGRHRYIVAPLCVKKWTKRGDRRPLSLIGRSGGCNGRQKNQKRVPPFVHHYSIGLIYNSIIFFCVCNVSLINKEAQHMAPSPPSQPAENDAYRVDRVRAAIFHSATHFNENSIETWLIYL